MSRSAIHLIFPESLEKCPEQLSGVILLATLADHIFQSFNSETFYAKWIGWHMECEEFHPAEEQHYMRIIGLLTWRRCPEFGNDRLLLMFHY